MKKLHVISTLLSAAALSVALASTVSAAPSIHYSGSSCQTDKSTPVRRPFNGSIDSNIATGYTTVNCPMDMLYGVAGVSKGYASITVVYTDGSTANDFACTAMSRSLMGSGLKWQSKDSKGTPVGKRTTMAFAADKTSYSGHSYLRCYLPAADKGKTTSIQAYAVTQ